MGHGVVRLSLLLIAGLVLTLGVGCAGKPKLMPQDVFWNNLADMCGKAYPGRVVSDSTSSATFEGKPLELRVSGCTNDTITMPLLVGGQGWATLTVSRTEGALRLKHAHQPDPDGTSLPSGYGGDTSGPGTEVAQDFYADEFTEHLGEGTGDTVWTIELRPGAVLSYKLRREGTSRQFHAVFDLTRGQPEPTALPGTP